MSGRELAARAVQAFWINEASLCFGDDACPYMPCRCADESARAALSAALVIDDADVEAAWLATGVTEEGLSRDEMRAALQSFVSRKLSD